MKRLAVILGLALQLSATGAHAKDECGGFAINAKDNKYYWATKVCNQTGEVAPMSWSAEQAALGACQETSRNPDACRFIEKGECVAGRNQNGGFASLVAYDQDHFVGCGRTESAAQKAAKRTCMSKHPGARCVVRTTIEY